MSVTVVWLNSQKLNINYYMFKITVFDQVNKLLFSKGSEKIKIIKITGVVLLVNQHHYRKFSLKSIFVNILIFM